MDKLPPLCQELILKNLTEKDYQICLYAANCALVGNNAFTNLAQLLWEIVDPGCTDHAYTTLEKEIDNWQLLNDNFQTNLDAIPKPKTIPPNITSKSTIKDLRATLLEFNIKKSCSLKADYWELLQASAQIAQADYTNALKDLELKKDTYPTLSKCFIRPDKRLKIKKVKTDYKTKRITATKAKTEYMLTEKELKTINCELVRNPHYGSAAPMRLYLLSEIETLHNNKFKNKKEVDQTKLKRENKAQKAKETHDRNIALRKQELKDLFNEQEFNRLLAYSDESYEDYEKYLQQGKPSIKTKLQMSLNRMIELRTALESRNCELREDSKLCLNYINDNSDNLQYVVDMMLEMKFLFAHTNYSQYRQDIFDELVEQELEYEYYYDAEELGLEASEKAKKRAIKYLPNALSYPDLPPRFKQWCRS
jgi:hypothetical protein